MKICGHIRIDEIGRIVIPKEMRKVLKLDESRLAEMYIDKDKLVIKRYSPLCYKKDFLKRIVMVLSKAFNCECIAGSREKVIAVSCESLSQMEGRSLTQAFAGILKDKAPLILNVNEGAEMVEIVKNYSVDYSALALVGVDSQISRLGFICLINLNGSGGFSDENLQILKVAKELILLSIDV